MEGIMKKKLLLGIAALALACSSVQASYLKIEDEEDVSKTSKAIASFWDHHSQERNKVLTATLDALDIEHLKKSDHYLATHIRMVGKSQTLKDIKTSLSNQIVQKDEELSAELSLLDFIINFNPQILLSK